MIPKEYPAAACARWNERWDNPFPSWRKPIGLERFSAFVGLEYAFEMYPGFGWVPVEKDFPETESTRRYRAMCAAVREANIKYFNERHYHKENV